MNAPNLSYSQATLPNGSTLTTSWSADGRYVRIPAPEELHWRDQCLVLEEQIEEMAAWLEQHRPGLYALRGRHSIPHLMIVALDQHLRDGGGDQVTDTPTAKDAELAALRQQRDEAVREVAILDKLYRTAEADGREIAEAGEAAQAEAATERQRAERWAEYAEALKRQLDARHKP